MTSRSPVRSLSVLVCVAVFATIASGLVVAQSSNQLVILNARVDLPNNTLFVEGANFVWQNDARPTVAVSGLPLPVTLATATQLQIALPPGIEPGTYLLKVSRGNGTPKNDVFAISIGVVGDKGAKGDTGAVGPAGATGPIGPAGATGASGPQGIKGDTGSQGQPGPQGVQGVAGPLGPMGLQGPQGSSGTPGAKGLNWRGDWANFNLYQTDDAVAFGGSSWVALQARRIAARRRCRLVDARGERRSGRSRDQRHQWRRHRGVGEHELQHRRLLRVDARRKPCRRHV